MNQATAAQTSAPRRNGLYILGSLAALTLGILFLIGMIKLISEGFQPGASNSWLPALQDNWLIVLFKLNAGIGGISFDRLSVLDALDIGILALVGLMMIGLYVALKQSSRIASIIAAILPFLGIVLFIATKIAGRSAVMAAGLVISFVMWRCKIFGKALAVVGILASLFLLVGDFGTSTDSRSYLVAAFIGIGYILLTAWFFWIGQRLFLISRAAPLKIEK